LRGTFSIDNFSDLSGCDLASSSPVQLSSSHYGAVRWLHRGAREDESGVLSMWCGVDTMMLSREIKELDGRKVVVQDWRDSSYRARKEISWGYLLLWDVGRGSCEADVCNCRVSSILLVFSWEGTQCVDGFSSLD